jgi:hypothetical protein
MIRTLQDRGSNTWSDAFFVLDFDRTIANTDMFHELLEVIVEQETGISAVKIGQAKRDAESASEPFDTIGYVQRLLHEVGGNKTLSKILHLFITKAQTMNMRTPGTDTLLHLLDEKGIPYGIITYGGASWQLAKIEAAGLLAVPHLVTHIQEKGRIFESWKRRDGLGFVVPLALTRDLHPLQVTTLVFLDDKAVSFRHMPEEGVKAVYVAATDNSRPVAHALHSDELPPSVVRVQGIDGAIELLFKQ